MAPGPWYTQSWTVGGVYRWPSVGTSSPRKAQTEPAKSCQSWDIWKPLGRRWPIDPISQSSVLADLFDSQSRDLDDPESDVASASGQSASVHSTPSPFREPIQDVSGLGSLPFDTFSERVKNTPYKSSIPMSQFRREMGHIDWGTLVESLKNGLTGNLRQQNDNYQLIDYGGSSSVWAAAFKGRRSDALAIKVLRNDGDSDLVDLPTELRIMGRLKHNHIVAFVGHFTRKDQIGVLLYPLAICNLAQCLREASEGNLGQKGETFDILRTAPGCLSSAVKYLHSLPIKHKDIKPENILIDRYGSVHLADFGISKEYEDDTITNGHTPFTARYAPPEVVSQDKRDLSSDIFSLGCVFLEIFTVILGKSLKAMSSAIFGGPGSEPQSYHQSLHKVGQWLRYLLDATSLISTLTLVGIFNNHDITARCLDTIRRMMSRAPADRPSIAHVYDLFKTYSAACPECHDMAVAQHETKKPDSDLPVQCVHPRGCDSRVGDTFTVEPISLKALASSQVPVPLRSKAELICSQGKTGQIYNQTHQLKGHHDCMGITWEGEETEYISEAESNYESEEQDQKINPALHKLKFLIRARVLLMLQKHQDVSGDCEPPSRFRQCNPGSGSTGSVRQGSPIRGSSPKRRSTGTTGRRKNSTRQDSDDNSDQEDEKNDRRRSTSGSKAESSTQSPKFFACPFYQRQPHRFKRRACSWRGYPNISREHLRRVHKIVHCFRCHEPFPSEQEVSSHLRLSMICEVRDRDSAFNESYDWGQGFGTSQADKIENRWKAVEDKEKWEKIYRILFPYDLDIPSPYVTSTHAELKESICGRIREQIRPHTSEFDQQELDRVIREAIEDGFDDYAHRHGPFRSPSQPIPAPDIPPPSRNQGLELAVSVGQLPDTISSGIQPGDAHDDDRSHQFDFLLPHPTRPRHDANRTGDSAYFTDSSLTNFISGAAEPPMEMYSRNAAFAEDCVNLGGHLSDLGWYSQDDFNPVVHPWGLADPHFSEVGGHNDDDKSDRSNAQ